MSSDDLWQAYARGVKKIAKAAKTAIPHKQTASSRRKPGSSGTIPLALKPASSEDNVWTPPFSGMTPTYDAALDRRTERLLRQGKIALQARLDLHGKTQTEAYDALARFIASVVKAGKRNLLIITGKGRGNAGVLKTSLPNWLQTLPEACHILTIRPAAPQHGGDGAFYVMLKKRTVIKS